MIVSFSAIRRAAAWAMRTFSRWCSVSLTDSRTSAWSRRLIAPPCDRHQRPAMGQLVEVAANRDPRHIELIRKILDGDSFLRLEEFEDAPATFFDEQLRHLPTRHVDHDCVHPWVARPARAAGCSPRLMMRCG